MGVSLVETGMHPKAAFTVIELLVVIAIIGILAALPWSWHNPQWPNLDHGEAMTYNNAQNVISFVDGHMNYITIYWNSGFRYPNGALSLASDYDPPDSYNYQWSAN